MLIRVYAVFSRDRRVLVGLLSYAAVGTALAGWALFGQSSAAETAVVKCLVYTPEAEYVVSTDVPLAKFKLNIPQRLSYVLNQPSSLLLTILLEGFP